MTNFQKADLLKVNTT